MAVPGEYKQFRSNDAGDNPNSDCSAADGRRALAEDLIRIEGPEQSALNNKLPDWHAADRRCGEFRAFRFAG